MMIPVVCVIGRSNSGKTTVVKKLVAELKSKGYRVATIKHAPHGFDGDCEGKDSWHFTQAGSDMVLLSSPNRLLLSKSTDADSSLAELLRLVSSDFDIVLAEGFKKSRMPKIHVFRDGWDDELLCPEEELMAVVADRPFAYGAPQFSHEDTQRLAEFIESELLSATMAKPVAVSLYADGTPIPMTDFVQSMFARTLRGMLSSLKRVPEFPQTLDISVRFSNGATKENIVLSAKVAQELSDMALDVVQLTPTLSSIVGEKT